jgi:hypothetical protein
MVDDTVSGFLLSTNGRWAVQEIRATDRRDRALAHCEELPVRQEHLLGAVT